MSTVREEISGKAISVRGNDIDTDRIIPARYLRCVVFDGLGEHAFEDDRAQLKAAGKTHPFDQPEFGDASLLFVNKNFGCGSSREHAPQSIMRWGIQAIVGESFAEIFLGNCTALGVPCVTVDEATAEAIQAANEKQPDVSVTLDIKELKLTVGDQLYDVTMDPGIQLAFLKGSWDTTVELLEGKDAVEERVKELGYFNAFASS